MNAPNDSKNGYGDSPFTSMMSMYQRFLDPNQNPFLQAFMQTGGTDTGSGGKAVETAWNDWTRLWQEWIDAWVDVWGGWNPFGRVLDRDDVPSICFVVDTDAECTDPKEVPLHVTIAGDVEVVATNLREIGKDGKLLRSKVDATIVGNRRALKVQLVKLKKANLKAGQQFLGSVYAEEKVTGLPLALIYVLVISDGSSGGGGGEGVGSPDGVTTSA